MINLHDVTLRRGPHVLIKEANWTIYHKQRIGVIGANGCGKSSLFALLLNELQPDLGEVDFPRNITFASVAQETPTGEQPAIEFVLDGDAELRQIEAQLAIAEEKNDGMAIATGHDKLAIIEGHKAPSRAAQILAGLGFAQEEISRPLNTFSGGWRARLGLAKALMCRSDVMFLDEPTNHLDLDAILWLEQWLGKYQGTLLMVSHDRDFLDHTVDHIAYIAHQRLSVYPGNYSSFEKQHAAELMLQQATYEKQQKHIAHMRSFVDRFRAKATKARQAQSRLKAIEKMELICAVQTESPFTFQFRKPASCPSPLLSLQHGKIGYGTQCILTDIELSITPKDRIGVLGPNGAGKSSLIKVLAGKNALQSGVREAAPGLKIGYFAQHQVDHLKGDDSPLTHLRRLAEGHTDVILRTFLGSFGFSGDQALAPIAHFSGGEKSRLTLALLVWTRPNLLLLDEPTNHLDLDMRQALSIALQDYEGAMLLVSHDRFLVRTTTDQLWLVANGKLQPFEGDVDDYQAWLFDFRKQQAAKKEPSPTPIGKGASSQTARSPSREKRRSLANLKRLEAELAKLEHELTTVEGLLAGPSLYQPENQAALQKHVAAQAAIKQKLEEAEKRWLEAHDDDRP